MNEMTAPKLRPCDYIGKPDFPYETFVEKAVKQHLVDDGFEIIPHRFIDVIAVKDNVAWHIEAKGKTSASGLDFRTGIGQLLQRMADPMYQYGIAIPNTAQFQRQAAAFAPWVLAKLKLHWIWVSENGSVTFDYPPQ